MRRLFLPLLILAVVVTAGVLADRANRAADAGEPDTTVATDSLGTPIVNVRRIPEWLRQPTSNQEFEDALQSVLDEPEVPADRCLRVHRNGIEIAVENADTPLTPAELQRLVTVAAVESLGRETVFVTKVVSNDASPVAEGVLDGDVWLVGGADPVLSTNEYLTRFDDDRASTSLDQLAAELAVELRRRGISEIGGGVVGDEFRFSPSETDYVGTVWTETDNADNVVGPLSGLLVNDGFEWDRQTSTITRSEDPARMAAGILTDLLIRRGITVAEEPTTGEQPASSEQVLLASVESPPITEIAQRALIDGTTAEMLFKEVGRVNGLSPASNDAAFGMLITLLQQGLPVEGSLPLDGSGLSNRGRVTCDLLMGIIEQSPVGGIVSSSLKPIRVSSLADCAPAGTDNMRIISADRGHITALVGEMAADNGSLITFVLIANADTAGGADSSGPCNSIQQSLLEAIARYPVRYGPTPESIAPLAPAPVPETRG
ncbi:MAG: D-alanyl-D-alanine carboxypeptidase [Acidimicrobiaceae bacterium]|nr:D-alanyl-D-alanine carboxypeptidase [Acidimicrobiaceae bacterium]MDE0606937.1 D-alanyl-D-alanine carboxypeptidase [Acidimicrobiaceae bacterium]